MPVENDHRFFGRNLTETDMPEVLGQGFYDAFKRVGVNRFVLWEELDSTNKLSQGNWKQAFSKLQMWSLVDYEKIVFMDADKLVFKNIDHLFELDGDFAAPG